MTFTPELDDMGGIIFIPVGGVQDAAAQASQSVEAGPITRGGVVFIPILGVEASAGDGTSFLSGQILEQIAQGEQRENGVVLVHTTRQRVIKGAAHRRCRHFIGGATDQFDAR